MKIVYIANTRLPTEMAHGLQIMKMCEAFASYNSNDTNGYANDTNRGIDVELVVPWRFRISRIGKKDPFEYYKVERNFKIKKIFSLDLTPLNRFLGPVSSLTQALSFSFFASIYLFFKKADIIYSRDRFSLFFIDKKNVVFEAHKIPKSLFLKGVKKIITISKGIKQDLIKKGVDGNKIFVAPDAIDLDDFNSVEADLRRSKRRLDAETVKKLCRKKIELPLSKKIVLYTGHLYKWKGVETLALSSKFLDNDTVIIVVGGIAWYLSNFKKFVKENNLKNVLILGYQDYSKIPYFLKAADCLVLTGTRQSRISQYYTSPIKMFEYMTSGKPIVASDLPSFREILSQGNAILVKPDNPEALAEGIKKGLSNSGLVKRISEQAYKDVQKYTWDSRTKTILKFIILNS